MAHTDAVAELEDRKFTIGVESETDHLPVGEVRKLWAHYALKEKDVEILRAEELYRAALVAISIPLLDSIKASARLGPSRGYSPKCGPA